MTSPKASDRIKKLQDALGEARADVKQAQKDLVDSYKGKCEYGSRVLLSMYLRKAMDSTAEFTPIRLDDVQEVLDRALSEFSAALLAVPSDQVPSTMRVLIQKMRNVQRVESQLQAATERLREQQAASWEVFKPLFEARLRAREAQMRCDFDAKCRALEAKMERDAEAKLRALEAKMDAKFRALEAAKMAGSPSPPGGFMAAPPGSEAFDFVTQPLGGSGNDGSPSAPVDDASIATEPELQLNGEQPDRSVDSKTPPKGNPQPDDGKETKEEAKKDKAKHVYITRNGRWVAKLYHNKKMHHLGTHDTAAQAAKKYNEVARKFGKPEIDIPPPSETLPPARQHRPAKKGRKRTRGGDKDPKIKTRHYKNAYTFFLMDLEVRKRAQSSLSSADARKLSQVTKKIAQMWDKLDDEAKVPYEKKSQADKKRVNEEVDKLQAERDELLNQMAQAQAGCVHAASSSRDANPAAMNVTDTATAVPDPANAAAAPAAKRPRIDSNESA